MPVTPPETSYASLPYTVMGSIQSFGMNKANNWTLEYENIRPAIVAKFATSNAQLAFTVAKVGIYGLTSTLSDSTSSTVQKQVLVEDAYTGRLVQGVSTPVDRARAGFVQSPIRRMYWYNSANNDVIPQKHILYLRTGDKQACPLDEEAIKYQVLVQGKLRIAPNPTKCN